MTRSPAHRQPIRVLAAAMLAAMPLLAMAQQQRRNPPQGEALSDTVRMVERDSRGGQVLSAERVQYDGRDMHRVKVVGDDGRVRVYLREPQPPLRRAEPSQRPPQDRGGNRGTPTRGDDE